MKEKIQCTILGILKGMKNVISISIAFCLDFLIGNENITSEECDPWDSQGNEKCNFYFYCFLP